ncbi:MAG: ABC transporter substrate-binding protein, partial [Dehalococcoidia bacterium]|nr:ABC transporter substrate-binding protein [Dehalococcoidia bacterium]
EIVTGRGAEMVERLRTESRIGTVVADILEGSASHALTAKTAGITVPTLNIPAMSEKDVWYASPLKADPAGYAISYSVIVYNPYINSKLIKLDDAPKSFQDFLAPQWKGKIIATDPDLSITELNYFVPLLNQGIVTEDYLRSLGSQNLQYTTGEVERGKKISSGEFALTTVGTTATMVRFISEGAPVKAIRMKEGLTAGTIAISRVKNSPHPNAASLFIEWLLSAEGQQLHAKERATGSIRKGVTDYTPEAARVDLTGVTVTTDKDQEDSAQKFRDKWLSRMWKK